MSLHEPGQNNWIMDTRATNHIHVNEGMLETLSHNHNSHYVLVGNRFNIPITKTGHSSFPFHILHHPLHVTSES